MPEDIPERDINERLDGLEKIVYKPMSSGGKLVRAAGAAATYGLGAAAVFNTGFALAAGATVGGYLSWKKNTENKDWDLVWPWVGMVGGGSLAYVVDGLFPYVVAAGAGWLGWNLSNKQHKLTSHSVGQGARDLAERVRSSARGAYDGFHKQPHE